MNEETKFWIREEWTDIKITFKYFIREPYYEIKRFVKGYYNSTLLFWLAVVIFFKAWYSGIGGQTLKILGIIALLTYIYMFHRSGIARKYYEQEMIEGRKIE